MFKNKCVGMTIIRKTCMFLSACAQLYMSVLLTKVENYMQYFTESIVVLAFMMSQTNYGACKGRKMLIFTDER